MSIGDSKKLEVPAYKDLTLGQLRSFSAAARLGSLAAAARDLGLAQPTVWKQVQALEASFGVPLLAAHSRGCRPTEEGRILESLVRPILVEFDGLGRRYEEAIHRRETLIQVAATPRVIDEDMPGAIADFQRRRSEVKVILHTASDDEVAQRVDAGACDLGFSELCGPGPSNPRLSYELSYELDVLLIVPRRHPLARAKRVDPRSLGRHPMVTAPGALGDPAVRSQLHKHHVFSTPAKVESFTAAGVRRYVELGFGIGIIGGHLSPPLRRSLAQQGLVAHSLNAHFGRISIYAIRRTDALRRELHDEFVRVVSSTQRHKGHKGGIGNPESGMGGSPRTPFERKR
jgi:DNA-binding transcriptional LysR family regulator